MLDEYSFEPASASGREYNIRGILGSGRARKIWKSVWVQMIKPELNHAQDRRRADGS